MEMSEDQLRAETKRNIALYVGGIGSILWGVVFLLFISVLIKRDNTNKTRIRAEAMRRETAILKKMAEEQQLKDKSKQTKRPDSDSENEDDDDEDDDAQTSSSSAANRTDDKQLNGFFRRQSAVVVVTPLPEPQSASTQIIEPNPNTLRVPEINQPRPVEMPRSRKESLNDFKDTLAAALQSHVQNLRAGSASSSRRPSAVEGTTIDSCSSSIVNSRRPSAVDSPAQYLQGSRRSSLVNSRRPSAANPQEALRILPEYESLKFVPGMTGGADDLPRYTTVVGRSRRESVDNQGGLQGYANPLMFGESSSGKQPLEFDVAASDVLPAIPESPHPSQKRFD